MSRPRASFICALHNCLDLTREMLDSLQAHESLADCQMVLIDDASSDATPEFLETLRSDHRFTLLANETNQGFAFSNNRAARAAQADILLFVNNDLRFDRPWLQPMIELLSQAPEAGIIGNIQRNAASGLVDHAGIFFDLDGMPTHAHKNRANPPSGNWRERNAVTAACMATTKSRFLAFGGFDERYRNGFEDVDLCVRMKKEGLRHYVSHQSIVSHHVSSSPGRHLNNDRNSELFRSLHAEYCQRFGREEWAKGYLGRYARYWWRLDPKLFLKALCMLALRKAPSH